MPTKTGTLAVRAFALALMGACFLPVQSSAEGTIVWRNKPQLLQTPAWLGGNPGNGETGGGGNENEQGQAVTLGFVSSGNFSLTEGTPVSVGITASGNMSGVTFRASQSSSMPGLSVNAADGTVSGNPTGAPDTGYIISVEAVRSGSAVGETSSLNAVLRAPLAVDVVPDDMALPYNGPFPLAGLAASSTGGDAATVSWTLENAPAWMVIQKTGPGLASLFRVTEASIGQTPATTVTLVAKDADGREDRSKSFNVASAAPPACEIEIGNVCQDGSIYAGKSHAAGGTWNLYIAAADIGPFAWNISGGNVPGSSSDTDNLFDGIKNTTAALTYTGIENLPAMQACAAMGPGWYLPARVEIQMLDVEATKSKLGSYGLGNINYWTSSTNPSGSISYIRDGSGVHVIGTQSNPLNVRCFHR